VIETAIARGLHPTGATPDSIALFKDDIAYQVKAGFCKVMLSEDLQRLRPHNLKISPVAVVPQSGQRGRIILDLSFPVYQDVNGVVTAVQSSVNDTTTLSAPDIPVKRLGRCSLNCCIICGTHQRGCTFCSRSLTSVMDSGVSSSMRLVVLC
jgi:hypothetical protein